MYIEKCTSKRYGPVYANGLLVIDTILYFRNEFNFLNVLGIIKSSGLLQSKWGFALTLQDTQSIHDSINIPKLNILLIFTFYYKYLNYINYL